MALVVAEASQEQALQLVSVEDYRRITGDSTSTSGSVANAITDALRLIEESLGRALSLNEYTEVLPIKGDRVFPSVTPITDAGGYTLYNNSLIGADPDNVLTWDSARFGSRVDEPQSSVTYTGGYDYDTLPTTLRRAIASAAQDLILGATTTTTGTTGASSVRSGDVSITYRSDYDPGSYTVGLGSITLRAIAPWRKRRI